MNSNAIPMTKFVTAESVRKGHPDKFCDQIADRILDAHLIQDPRSRVAVEVFATAGKLMIAGEVTSNAKVDYYKIVYDAISNIGYNMDDLCDKDDHSFEIEVSIHEQSPDIAAAVDKKDEIGAGDQGIVVGYATNETPEYLPLPVVLAHGLCRELDALRSRVVWLGADGKAQVTVAYENGVPKAVTTIVLSVQHVKEINWHCIRYHIMEEVIKQVIPANMITRNTQILINPAGAFVLGGPAADTGLTGRKLAVDQYGPVAHIGGGALSGKDPTKVDRSGAYAARWVAKNIVAAGLADRCEVQIAYAIGCAKPVSVTVDTFGTGIVSDEKIAIAVDKTFDLSVGGIIRYHCLRAPIYTPLTAYGHFGRRELHPSWEIVNRRTALTLCVDEMSRG